VSVYVVQLYKMPVVDKMPTASKQMHFQVLSKLLAQQLNSTDSHKCWTTSAWRVAVDEWCSHVQMVTGRLQ